MLKSAQLKRILANPFDVIHYHNISLVGGPGILAYGQGIKLYTMREFWLVCPMHVLYKYNRMLCTKRNCLLCIPDSSPSTAVLALWPVAKAHDAACG